MNQTVQAVTGPRNRAVLMNVDGTEMTTEDYLKAAD